MENCSFGTLVANLYEVNNAKAAMNETITCMDVDTLLTTIVHAFNRQCMELPKTYDGVPIHIGDKVLTAGPHGYVTVLGVSGKQIFFEDEYGVLKELHSNLVRSADEEQHEAVSDILRCYFEGKTEKELSDIAWKIMGVL
jgi:hypothetical protein